MKRLSISYRNASSFRTKGATSSLFGMKLKRDRKQHTIALLQLAYIQNLLESYGIQDCNGIDTLMLERSHLSKKMSLPMPEEKEEMKCMPYREAVGKLLYLVIST